MKTKMMMLILVLGSWGAFAQHDHAGHEQKKTDQAMVMFKDPKLGKAYEHYIHVKNSLVASDNEEAKASAIELSQALRNAKVSTASIEAATKLANTSDLDEQRKLFSTLSNEMATLVKDGKLSMGMLYLEYCPMANNNSGAYWLSNEKEIKNPYFGDKMLKCGSVKEMIH
ncbi:MAG: DUF3347 domain-containing protein [Cyclobacteriaceae bacterium]|jgi:hypothetical protein|nr:DUF3347 domain-containing protein [Cyclobacteriaceae bacterium]MCK6618119.1 DUF3347 domain-containing protein [Cyclobacteriaceae bacterium]